MYLYTAPVKCHTGFVLSQTIYKFTNLIRNNTNIYNIIKLIMKYIFKVNLFGVINVNNLLYKLGQT